MQESVRERLDSWKEIAAYLGRDLRTVRRWEKDKGLPVRRVPGGERQAVFAYRAEIDAWLLKTDTSPSGPQLVLHTPVSQELATSRPAPTVYNIRESAALHATTAPSGWWWKPIFTFRRITLAVFLLVMLAVFAFGFALINTGSTNTHLDKIAFNGNSVQAWSPKGELLWTYSFDRPLSEGEEKDSERIRIIDEGSAGKQAVIAAPLNIPGQPDSPSDALFALSSARKLRWRKDFNESVRFNGNSYGPPWGFGAMLVTDRGESTIWATTYSFFWSPSQLLKLSSDGQELGRFVNWGHIHVLSQFRSIHGSFVLAGGINNECNCAMLAVLQEDQPSGSSPSVGSPGSKCEDCPAGRPYRYILFPRSELAAATDYTYNQVAAIVSSEGTLRVGVKETAGGEGLGADWEMYKLSPDFVPQTFSVSDHMPVLHRQLEAKGKISHSVAQCPELHQPRSVKVWSPEEGWQSIWVVPVQVEGYRDQQKQSAKNVRPAFSR